MARKSAVKLRCPICKKAVTSHNAEFPFCSSRCRTIDLGKWASGAYVVPSAVADGEDKADDILSQHRDKEQDDDL